MHKRPTAALLIILIAGAAYAHTGVEDPDVKARMHGMTVMGGASKTLSQMARGQMAYDTAKAEAAVGDLAREAARVTALFEPNSDDPKSEAKPEIWTEWAKFTDLADKLEQAVAMADVSSAEAVGASMREIGRACGACHETYQE